MPLLTAKLAARLTSKLKKTLWDMGEETRLHQCRKAIAEAFDFNGEGAMHGALPCMAPWNGEWCANHLADKMFVADADAARRAVELIETQFGRILFEDKCHLSQAPLA